MVLVSHVCRIMVSLERCVWHMSILKPSEPCLLETIRAVEKRVYHYGCWIVGEATVERPEWTGAEIP